MSINFANEKWQAEPDDDDIRVNDREESYGGKGYDREKEEAEHERALELYEEELRRSLPAPPIRKYGNTGVKAVIADYAEARQKKIDAAKEAKRVLLAKAQRYALQGGSGASGPAAAAASRQGPCSSALEEGGDELDELEHELFGSDDEFRELEGQVYARYKAQKLGEILAQVPTFGAQLHVTDGEFVDAVDGEHPSTLVLVHLFEEHLPPCRWLDDAIEELAPQYPYVKFLRIRASLANPDLDPVALPALLVYQDKKLLESILCFNDEIQRVPKASPFNVDHVRQYLIRKKILK